MSAEKDTMIAALVAMEAALQTFAAAHSNYQSAERVASAAASGHPYKNQQFLIEQVAGVDKLDGLIVQRLRALGLQGLLEQARSDGTAADLSALTAKITGLVP